MEKTRSKANQAGKTHWIFFRSGGVNQVLLKTSDDLSRLGDLDLKLWMALSVPAKGIEFDPATAAFLDTDGDGQIRPREILEAVRWTCSAFKDPGTVLSGTPWLDLENIKDPVLLANAKRLLSNLGKSGEARVTLEDVIRQSDAIAGMLFNGDGVLTVDAADSENLKAAMTDIITALGPATDRSGKPGVDLEKLEAYDAQVRAIVDWENKVADQPAIAPLGPESTAAAVEAVRAVEAKVDDYFARCRMIAFDPRAAGPLNREESDYKAISTKELNLDSDDLAAFPLCVAAADKPLPLNGPVNPAWESAIARLAERALRPVLGPSTRELSERDWLKAKAAIAPYRDWLDSRPRGSVSDLPRERVRAFLDQGMASALRALVEKDLALAPETDRMAEVEKAVRFQKDLGTLLRNSVNFADFYSGTPAIFQTGTLYMDARACALCLNVTDEGKHASLTSFSGAFLIYCDLSSRDGKKKKIVAVFTDGDSDGVFAGRNGMFIDRSGNDWNATVTKVILNPVSVRQAFWLPYKKFFRMIEEQIGKRAQSAEEATTKKLEDTAGTVATIDKTAAPPGAQVPAKKIDLGTIALIGTAIGGVSALVSGILQAVFGLGIWLPLGIAAMLVLISGPSMVLASLKLRKRNLGPLLEANGWAINTKALVNIPFGATMTSLAALPPGTLPFLADPFAEKKKPWKRYVFLVVVLAVAGMGAAWKLGALDSFLPDAWSFKRVWSGMRKVKIEVPAIPKVEGLAPQGTTPPPGK